MKQAFLILPLVLAPAEASTQPLGPKPMLHTPDVISPAVLPYLACLYAERGLSLLRAADGTQVAYDKSGSDCAAARAKAKTDAAKLLDAKPLAAGQDSGTFVEQALDDMDRYVASLPMQQQQAAESAVIGIPVTIEDEIKPAYERYDDCLKTQASGSPVTSVTTMAKFNEAMKVCTSVRDYAVAEATKALSAKGWDEPTRQRAAETTFAKIDESWLAMGRQYQELLAKREAALAAKKPR